MACNSTSSIMPLLRAVAPRLSRHIFPHRQCSMKLAQVHSFAPTRIPSPSSRQTPFLRAFRSQSTVTSPQTTSPLANLGRNITKSKKASFASSFPETSSKTVAYWLFGSAASVFGIVIFGGLTRLTESGYGHKISIYRLSLY